MTERYLDYCDICGDITPHEKESHGKKGKCLAHNETNSDNIIFKK